VQVKDYAKFYLKFWFRNAAGRDLPANNQPPELQRLIAAHRKVDMQLIHDALYGVATGQVPPDKTVTELLAWFATNPTAIASCDDVLKQKQKVTSFNHLIAKAYALERSKVANSIHKYLMVEITKDKEGTL